MKTHRAKLRTPLYAPATPAQIAALEGLCRSSSEHLPELRRALASVKTHSEYGGDPRQNAAYAEHQGFPRAASAHGCYVGYYGVWAVKFAGGTAVGFPRAASAHGYYGAAVGR